jgi:hypothetical protein
MSVKHRNDTRLPIPELRQRVTYNPATGELRWPTSVPAHLFQSERAANIWHTKVAGKPVRKRRRWYVVVELTAADGRRISMEGHRVAWALMKGEWPEHEIDYEDRDPGNNRWRNLRPADHQRNQWNKGLSRTNKSGFKGVHWSESAGCFVAQITIDGKAKHLGTFTDPGAGGEVYAAAAKAFHGDFAAKV